MAGLNGKELPEQETSTRFPEAEGKIVESIELIAESGYYGINVNFTDNTAMVFSIEPSVVAFPYFGDWTDGERKILKQYERARSVSLKTVKE
ncbi:MAG TPA: hypothetical protein VG759_06770 [Candidatus Angelobacter sp.]|jgi:hypothetical protein|nr:hypothetical protein [Candidatus Angelobacter sp.]